MVRKANISDLKQILELEEKYYEGHSISEELSAKWIENWECAPGYFVHNHSLWLKELK